MLAGCLGADQPGAALERHAVGAAQVQSNAPAGGRHLDRAVVHLHGAHRHRVARRLHDQPVAGAHRAPPERAGHDGADPFQREDPVDRQARRPFATTGLDLGGDARQGVEQLRQSATVAGADHDDRRGGERRLGQEPLDIVASHLEQLVVDQVGLGERHDAALDPQQLDHREVLDGLRHDAVVGRDHEQEQVDAAGAGHHGAHEALVTGHVDHAETPSAGQLELGVAQLDRDASLALFAQAVGVGAGQARDQGRLAVIDVAGGAEGERQLGRGRIGHGAVLRPA